MAQIYLKLFKYVQVKVHQKEAPNPKNNPVRPHGSACCCFFCSWALASLSSFSFASRSSESQTFLGETGSQKDGHWHTLTIARTVSWFLHKKNRRYSTFRDQDTPPERLCKKTSPTSANLASFSLGFFLLFLFFLLLLPAELSDLSGLCATGHTFHTLQNGKWPKKPWRVQ